MCHSILIYFFIFLLLFWKYKLASSASLFMVTCKSLNTLWIGHVYGFKCNYAMCNLSLCMWELYKFSTACNLYSIKRVLKEGLKNKQKMPSVYKLYMSEVTHWKKCLKNFNWNTSPLYRCQMPNEHFINSIFVFKLFKYCPIVHCVLSN